MYFVAVKCIIWTGFVGLIKLFRFRKPFNEWADGLILFCVNVETKVTKKIIYETCHFESKKNKNKPGPWSLSKTFVKSVWFVIKDYQKCIKS